MEAGVGKYSIIQTHEERRGLEMRGSMYPKVYIAYSWCPLMTELILPRSPVDLGDKMDTGLPLHVSNFLRNHAFSTALLNH